MTISHVLLTTAFLFANLGKLYGDQAMFRMSGDEKVDLYWTVNYPQSRVNFHLNIPRKMASSSSIFGFGMSDRGEVTNADLLIIRCFKDGVIFEDSWSDDHGDVYEDAAQNYHLTEYGVRDDGLWFHFWRYIDTDDPHDFKMDNGTMHLTFLMKTENVDGSGETRSFPSVDFVSHIKDNRLNALMMEKWSIFAQILKPVIPLSYYGHEKTENFSILQPDVTLPAKVTTYWCSIHMIPDSIQKKVHSVAFQGTISNITSGIVHHIEVFMCEKNDEDIPMFSGECASIHKSSKVNRCNRVMAAWAIGAKAFYYPKEAGMPFGGEDQSRFLRLEIHYHNPHKRSGLVDRSGITFFLTEELRQYDAGILEVGVSYTDKMVIPPNQTDFVISGSCPAQCTEKGLPRSGITIFGSELHAHSTGTRVWTSQYRGDKPLPELIRDNHYTTWYEEIRHIYPPVNLLPGDSLVTSCAFDTSARTNVTYFGMGIFEEMCVNYLHYYPVSPLEVCKSSVSSGSLANFFTLQKLFSGFQSELDLLQLPKNYVSLQWNKNVVDSLNLLYHYGSMDIECHQHNGEQFPGKWEEIHPV